MNLDLNEYFIPWVINTTSEKHLVKVLTKFLESGEERKKCPECGGYIRFATSTLRSKGYCSVKCMSGSKEIKDKRQSTSLIKYGAISHTKTKEYLEKREATWKQKYGVAHVSQLDSIKQKKSDTTMKNYGVTHYSKTDTFKEIASKIFKDETVREKMKATNLEKYGVECVLKNKLVRDKINITILKKYGVTHLSESELVKNKRNKTFQDRYNGHPMLIQEISDKASFNKKLCTIGRHNNKNIKNIKRGFSYTCDICKNETEYIGEKQTKFLLQRLRLGVNGCSHCLPKHSDRSSVELFLESAIQNLGIKTEHHRSIDIFLPDFNIGIEVNGTYWHSEEYKEKDYHKNKVIKFADEGIQILGFTDYEINNNFDKVMGYIKGKLGMNEKIGASKCKVLQIDAKTAKEYCEKYHIHGYAKSKMHYALEYKGEIVSVLTAGRNRFNEKGIEIIRLCSHKTIIGGFKRLLNRIVEEYKEHEIISYVDAFLGGKDNVFSRNGFSFVSHTVPGYSWVVEGGELLSRYKTQKSKLKTLFPEIYDDNKTEDDIMQESGAKKLYNAGNYKYILTNTN